MDLLGTATELRVPLSAELARIARLPRRVVGEDELRAQALELSEIFRRPGGEGELRPIQAQALVELGIHGGLFAPIRVGGGKTLISLLASRVAFAERPLLLVPAKLHRKTQRDWIDLATVWDLPPAPEIMSYELLGRAQAAEALDELEPDLIVADEAHKLKNTKAAVTRRVRRYMRAHPEVIFVAMSGTITKRSLFDFAHILSWCFPLGPPLPMKRSDLEIWADALDERKGQLRTAHPGALEVFCNQDERRQWNTDPKGAARRAFRRRLVETPGIVATDETPIDATITITELQAPDDHEIDRAFATLRDKWITPDGWPIVDALTLFRHARELALGFFYVWDPRPPRFWLDARSAWCAFVRKILGRSRSLDSELQVRNAHPDAPELHEWIAVRDAFTPNTVPRWISRSVVRTCAKWLHDTSGIVWTEHTVFGKALAHHAGVPFFGRGGESSGGYAIEDQTPGSPMVCSVQSNAEGRNLQAWSSNLVSSPPPNGLQWEQMLGRTHRDGQTADEVSVDVLISCAEHVGAFAQAMKDARYVEDTTGSPQKLLIADVDIPDAIGIMFRNGARWNTKT